MAIEYNCIAEDNLNIMTQEEKTLLLKDLCGRLPYGVMIECSIECGESIDLVLSASHIDELVNNSLTVKPYLRSISNMTEEELDEYEELEWAGDFVNLSIPLLDWLNKNMFDYRGLIEKGLAIEALEGMYNLKK